MEDALLLGFIPQQLITPVAIVGSSVLAATFAYLSIRTTRSIARKKNAIDLVFEYHNEKAVQSGLKEIRAIHACPNTNIDQFGYKEKQTEETAVHLNQVLNYFEFVAVAVKEGIYDESILKRSFCSSFITCYEQTKPYISKVREQFDRHTVFQDFEFLAKKWKASPLKLNKNTNGR